MTSKQSVGDLALLPLDWVGGWGKSKYAKYALEKKLKTKRWLSVKSGVCPIYILFCVSSFNARQFDFSRAANIIAANIYYPKQT